MQTLFLAHPRDAFLSPRHASTSIVFEGVRYSMADFFLRFLSQVFGWIYTFCWSLSFYPQPILNVRRKSTAGTTIDFPAINLPGFTAYFISNAAFLYSPVIREQYALRNHGLTPTVQFNDLAFAGHAVVLSLITLTQFYAPLWGFKERSTRGAGATISTTVIGILVGCVLGVLVIIFVVIIRHDPNPRTGWAWIDVVSSLSGNRFESTNTNITFT